MVASLLVVVLIYYFFLRAIQKLKQKVRNKARVEGCIVEAQLVEEATNSMSLFFKSKVHSARNKTPRYDDGASTFVPIVILKSFDNLVDASAKRIVAICL